MGELIQFSKPEIANLYGIGLQVPVPKGAKFIDSGEVTDTKHRELWGTCTSKYSEGKIVTEIMINGILPREPLTFARGHEEGHAAFYLGNLTAIKEVATLLNLDLGFFTEDYCSTHDEATKRFLIPGRGTSRDYQIVRGKSFAERELIANIGGLMALVNSSAEEELIKKVRQGIKNGEINPYPVAKVMNLRSPV